MNAGDLPLGTAPHLCVRTQPGGATDIAGRFLRLEHAVQLGAFLALLTPENKYHATTETPVLPGLEGKV